MLRKGEVGMKFKDRIKAMYVIGMAYSRSDFKNKIESKVGGAFFEHLKAEYATFNGETKWVDHWRKEVDGLVDSQLVVELLHTTTFKDKAKACREVLDILKAKTASYMRTAKGKLETTYYKRKMKDISEDVAARFFERVEKVIQETLASD
jgi:hypothetical protein